MKANSSMPNNCSTFLRCDENKTELFPFIAKALVENIAPHGLFVGYLVDMAVANQYVDLESLMACNIEKVDERMFAHFQHSAELCLCFGQDCGQ